MDEQSHRHGKMTGKFQVLRPSLFTRCTNDPIPQKLLHLYSASLFCVATTCNRGRTTSADTTATSFSWSSIWPALTDLPLSVLVPHLKSRSHTPNSHDNGRILYPGWHLYDGPVLDGWVLQDHHDPGSDVVSFLRPVSFLDALPEALRLHHWWRAVWQCRVGRNTEKWIPKCLRLSDLLTSLFVMETSLPTLAFISMMQLLQNNEQKGLDYHNTKVVTAHSVSGQALTLSLCSPLRQWGPCPLTVASKSRLRSRTNLHPSS